ncbi:MAG TPA: DLW-39 family protein [Pedococcus sp.]|nr:DLW-39 family protein [Pedococcus sp.]
MGKKLLMLIVTAIGAAALQKKLKDQQAERNLWHEATDQPPN